MSRKEFKMSDEQLKKLLDACRPVPMIALQCGMPSSPQENANEAWKGLGLEMGFEHMSVRPISGKGTEHFTAEATASDEG